MEQVFVIWSPFFLAIFFSGNLITAEYVKDKMYQTIITGDDFIQALT